MDRRYWHFHYGTLDRGVLLGPHLRALEMAGVARDLGMESTLLVDDPGCGVRDGIRLASRTTFDLGEIRPGDAVVVADAAAARIPYQLARRGIPFHADCYGMPPPELVQIYRSWSPAHAWKDRVRRNLRYQFLSAHAERIYLSHPGQMAFLAGMLFAGSQRGDGEIVDALPRQVALLPMGAVPQRSEGRDNPFPPSTRDRPVFLWGGGIWAWFDLDTLLDAFAELERRGSGAALFFLSGRDHSGLEIHRKAVEHVRDRARALGLLDRRVFLNDKPVGAGELPAYLEHCRAGIMTNPDVLESQVSWRTRYLDLVGMGRPLVVAGDDPLGLRMASEGAAIRTPPGDISALADAIEALAGDHELAERMGLASARMLESLSWSASLEPFRQILSNPGSFRRSSKPGLHWVLRYALAPIHPLWS